MGHYNPRSGTICIHEADRPTDYDSWFKQKFIRADWLRLLPECHSLSIKTDTGNNYINTGKKKKNPLTGRKGEESTTEQNKDLSIVRQELTDMHGIEDFLPAAAHWCVFLRESHGL